MTDRLPSVPYGHRLLSTPAEARRLGRWYAEDAAGYEYVVGAYVGKEGAGVLDADLRSRQWTRDGSAWFPVPVEGEARQGWTADGLPIDPEHGRREVVLALKAWVDRYLHSERRSVWLWGACGRGKDALMRCVVADLTAAGARCESRSFPATVAAMRSAYAGEQAAARSWAAERAALLTCPVLHLTDVAPSRSDDVRELLYAVADERTAAGRVTLATSNVSAEAMEQTDARIASRVAAWLVLELRGPDYRAGRV